MNHSNDANLGRNERLFVWYIWNLNRNKAKNTHVHCTYSHPRRHRHHRRHSSIEMCASHTNSVDLAGQDSAINYSNNLSFSLLSPANICVQTDTQIQQHNLANGKRWTEQHDLIYKWTNLIENGRNDEKRNFCVSRNMRHSQIIHTRGELKSRHIIRCAHCQYDSLFLFHLLKFINRYIWLIWPLNWTSCRLSNILLLLLLLF